jgi:hypothetical protein
MESLLLGALSYYGNTFKNKGNNNNFINNNNNNNNYNNNNSNLINNNNSNTNTNNINNRYNTNTNNINNKYNTNIENNMNYIEQNQAKKKNPEFFQQFDSLSFDNLSKPTAENQAYTTRSGFNKFLQRDIDFQNDYSEFQNTDMHYNVVPKEGFVHNNMNPSTSRRETMINLDSNTRKYENLSGNNSLWQHKNEVEKFFDPVSNLTNVNGLPVVAGQLGERYIASFKNNNGNLPFKTDIKVLPGVDGKNAGPYAVTRIEPRNIDKLRSEINQKVTYINKPLITVKKGDMRAPDGMLTSFKIPSYREITTADLVPNKGTVEGPKQVGEFVHTNTSRGINDLNYVGGAYDSTRGKSIDPELIHFSEPKKENYMNDFTHSINAVNSRPVFTNVKSYTNYETDRDSIAQEMHAAGPHDNNGASYFIDKNSQAKPTMKQNNIIQNRNLGITGPLEKKNYMFSNDSILQTTKRETTNYNEVNNVKSGYQNTHVVNQDSARPTVRQSTVENKLNTNVAPGYQNTHVVNQDSARPTVRQSTVENQLNTHVTSGYQNTHLINQDSARPTVRQSTVENQLNTNVKSGYQNTHLINQDSARPTVRQSTVENQLNTNVTSGYQNTHLVNQDSARSTIKESTIINSSNNNISSAYQNTHLGNQDFAKPTIKQSTVENQLNTNVSSAYQNTHLANQDFAKPTIKQSTVENQLNTNVSSTYQNIHLANQDFAKPTIKQSTIENQLNTNVRSAYQNIHLANQDLAKPTIKQSTVENQLNTNVRPAYQNTHLINQDLAKPTIKQSTVGNQLNTNVRSAYQNTHLMNQDLAKPTIKQSTVINSLNTNITPNIKGNVVQNEDMLKPTNRQTTEINSHIGIIAGDSYKNVYIQPDSLKETIKETTIAPTPLKNIVTSVPSSYYINDENARATIKETVLHETPGGRIADTNKGYYNVNDLARTTIKQTTLLSNYKGGSKYNYEAPMLQDAERNMNIDDKKMQTAIADRMPNAKSDKLYGNICAENVKFQNKRQLLKGYVSSGGSSANYTVTPFERTSTSKKTDLNSNNFYHIDPLQISTLNNNPLVNDLKHPKNYDFNTGL